jgi:hypothetical protein
MVGDLAPKFSNNVLNALFINKDAPFMKEYAENTIFSDSPGEQLAEKVEVDIEELGKRTVYLIKPKLLQLSLKATSGAFYGG